MSDSDYANFVEGCPPPNKRQRQLIFDSLQKIVDHEQKTSGQRTGNSTKGTFVFTWGAGYQNQLGKRKQKGNQKKDVKQRKYSSVPLIVDLDYTVRSVVCGPLHTSIINNDGTVYSWGDGADSGEKKEWGKKGSTDKDKDVAKIVPFPVKIVSLACGGVMLQGEYSGHSVALSDNGEVFSWGIGKEGQLGHGKAQFTQPDTNTKLARPYRIDNGRCRNIKQVSCGNLNTMLRNKDGKVLSFGSNKHGQTGLAQGERENIQDPTELPHLPEMLYICCGPIFTTMISKDGALYVCGFGEYLYPKDSPHFSYEPRRIELPEPIKMSRWTKPCSSSV